MSDERNELEEAICNYQSVERALVEGSSHSMFTLSEIRKDAALVIAAHYMEQRKRAQPATEQPAVTYVPTDLPRYAEGAPCQGGGYADKQEESPTPEEIELYDCGRGYACCTAVFKCRLCNLRFVGRMAAPEVSW